MCIGVIGALVLPPLDRVQPAAFDGTCCWTKQLEEHSTSISDIIDTTPSLPTDSDDESRQPTRKPQPDPNAPRAEAGETRMPRSARDACALLFFFYCDHSVGWPGARGAWPAGCVSSARNPKRGERWSTTKLTSLLSLTRRRLSPALTQVSPPLLVLIPVPPPPGRSPPVSSFTSYPHTPPPPVDKPARASLSFPVLRFRSQVFTFLSHNNVVLSIFRSSGQAGPSSSLRCQAIHRFGCPTAGCLERRRSAPGCPKRLGCEFRVWPRFGIVGADPFCVNRPSEASRTSSLPTMLRPSTSEPTGPSRSCKSESSVHRPSPRIMSLPNRLAATSRTTPSP